MRAAKNKGAVDEGANRAPRRGVFVGCMNKMWAWSSWRTLEEGSSERDGVPPGRYDQPVTSIHSAVYVTRYEIPSDRFACRRERLENQQKSN